MKRTRTTLCALAAASVLALGAPAQAQVEEETTEAKQEQIAEESQEKPDEKNIKFNFRFDTTAVMGFVASGYQETDPAVRLALDGGVETPFGDVTAGVGYHQRLFDERLFNFYTADYTTPSVSLGFLGDFNASVGWSRFEINIENKEFTFGGVSISGFLDNALRPRVIYTIDGSDKRLSVSSNPKLFNLGSGDISLRAEWKKEDRIREIMDQSTNYSNQSLLMSLYGDFPFGNGIPPLKPTVRPFVDCVIPLTHNGSRFNLQSSGLSCAYGVTLRIDNDGLQRPGDRSR